MMSQGKVHTRLSCCKKVSWSYYEKPLQKEMTFAKFRNICLLTIRGCTLRSPHRQFRRIRTKNPLLSDQIFQLVAARITDTNEVKRSLRFYVTNTLCKELGYQAKQGNRALYPTTTDIRNHVYSAKKALELSKLDQENTRLKIDQCSRQILRHHIFCFTRLRTSCQRRRQTTTKPDVLPNTLSDSPREVAEKKGRAIWQHKEYAGCYIQDNEV